MRKRKHSPKTVSKSTGTVQGSRRNARAPMQRRKRLTGIGLVLGLLMAASIIGAAYTNRASDPFASSRASKPAPVTPVTPAKR